MASSAAGRRCGRGGTGACALAGVPPPPGAPPIVIGATEVGRYVYSPRWCERRNDTDIWVPAAVGPDGSGGSMRLRARSPTPASCSASSSRLRRRDGEPFTGVRGPRPDRASARQVVSPAAQRAARHRAAGQPRGAAGAQRRAASRAAPSSRPATPSGASLELPASADGAQRHLSGAGRHAGASISPLMRPRRSGRRDVAADRRDQGQPPGRDPGEPTALAPRASSTAAADVGRAQRKAPPAGRLAEPRSPATVDTTRTSAWLLRSGGGGRVYCCVLECDAERRQARAAPAAVVYA